MKLTIKTTTLQEMVAKSIKGASNNKMIPITSLMEISSDIAGLTLTTTDATNWLKISNNKSDGTVFYVVVPVDIFSKLVSKTTSENITLTLKENSLEVKGNGTYSIDLPLDENGNLIRFPSLSFENISADGNIKTADVKKILNYNRVALAETMEVPCLTGYYCGKDAVISTDSFKVCNNKVQLLHKPALIPTELMNLLAIVDEEEIIVNRDGSKILFQTPTVAISGVELEGIEDYPIDAIDSFINTEFTSNCVLNKQALLNVLDRLSLFIASYDNNTLSMVFTNEGVIISSKRTNGTELIKYENVENFKDFVCNIDIELFRSQVHAQEGEFVNLWFGHQRVIKMVCGNITQIVALLEINEA